MGGLLALVVSACTCMCTCTCTCMCTCSGIIGRFDFERAAVCDGWKSIF